MDSLSKPNLKFKGWSWDRHFHWQLPMSRDNWEGLEKAIKEIPRCLDLKKSYPFWSGVPGLGRCSRRGHGWRPKLGRIRSSISPLETPLKNPLRNSVRKYWSFFKEKAQESTDTCPMQASRMSVRPLQGCFPKRLGSPFLPTISLWRSVLAVPWTSSSRPFSILVRRLSSFPLIL